jgi:hypothetical protein
VPVPYPTLTPETPAMPRLYRLSVTRAFPSGAWVVAAIVGDTRQSRTYYGYTRREAVASFRAEFPAA